MKTIGLIGGTSWESTALYYRRINERVKERLGGLHSARLVLYSVDFDPIARRMEAGQWGDVGTILADAARTVEGAGADCLLLCSNTLHRVAPALEAAVRIPFLHLIDITAEAIQHAGFTTVGLLGTRFTMEQPFYRERLEERHGLTVLTPDAADREIVHRVIFDELCQGIVSDASRTAYREVVGRLAARGAQAIILGCTEIGMLLSQTDSPVPLFDTTDLHAARAVDFALRGGNESAPLGQRMASPR